MMNRRRYLATGSGLIAVLAGCSGGDEEVDDPQDTESDGGVDAPTENTWAFTPTPPSGEPDVQFGEGKLLVEDNEYTTDVYAEVVVENTGDAAAGRITLNVDWYDADDTHLGDSTGRLPSLDTGEVWIAQVLALTSEPEDIDRFEVDGEFGRYPPVAPDGMQVSETEIAIEEYSVQINGVAENNRDDEIGYLEAHGKIYDDQGRVIDGASTVETDIPAGRNWAFEIGISVLSEARIGEVADHVASLDAEPF